VHQAPASRGFHHLRIEQLGQRHPARFGPGTFSLTPRRLYAVPIVGEQGRQARFDIMLDLMNNS
jgi:hypothetical protein